MVLLVNTRKPLYSGRSCSCGRRLIWFSPKQSSAAAAPNSFNSAERAHRLSTQRTLGHLNSCTDLHIHFLFSVFTYQWQGPGGLKPTCWGTKAQDDSWSRSDSSNILTKSIWTQTTKLLKTNHIKTNNASWIWERPLTSLLFRQACKSFSKWHFSVFKIYKWLITVGIFIFIFYLILKIC